MKHRASLLPLLLLAAALLAAGCGGAPEEAAPPREGRPEAKTAVGRAVAGSRAKTASSLALAAMKPVAESLSARAAQEGNVPEGDSWDALDALVPDYIGQIPSADPWGTPYRYRSDGTSYELRSAGDDLAFGTADDVTLAGP